MSFDVRELEKFRDDLIGIKLNQDEILKKAVNEIALRVYRLIIKNTPVDTGWLKENWDIGPIIKGNNSYSVEIKNGTDYVEYVEYGHRIVRDGVTVGWKDGVFMVTMSENAVSKRVDKIVQNIVEKELSRRLHL